MCPIREVDLRESLITSLKFLQQAADRELKRMNGVDETSVSLDFGQTTLHPGSAIMYWQNIKDITTTRIAQLRSAIPLAELYPKLADCCDS